MFKKSNCKIKGGFTLIELLVVISIIVLMAALSLKSIGRAVANAKINKSTAEMTSLASTGASIYIDLKSRGYVRLTDYARVKTYFTTLGTGTGSPPTTPSTIPKLLLTHPAPYGEYAFTVSDFALVTDFQDCWDGPYAVWQTGTVSTTTTAGTNGPPTIDASVTATWIPSPPVLATLFPLETPLDPWRHCYGLGWDTTRQVMIIYSAGPDGIMQTPWGTTTVPASSDDLIYQFR